jgi:2-polyprenyl-3-methyl-5-hydroxy-6-metoxy-1,4-benzoquinol methylase
MSGMSQTSVRDFLNDLYLWLVRTFASRHYQKTAILHTASRYDMTTAPAEDFFAELYLQFIRQDIATVFGNKKIRILDVGCGQGRLSIPLAKEGHLVTGVDLSPEAIRIAGQYAQQNNVAIDLTVQDINEDTANFPSNSFDCILCTEMIYMAVDPHAVLKDFSRLAKPGGLVIVSFRPKMYYLLNAVLNHSWKNIEVISRTQGTTLNGIRLNWFTSDEIITLLKQMEISMLRICSIGKFSGIEGDPQACFCNPAGLNDEDRENLMELEIRYAETDVECGRYLYTSGIVIKK